MKSHRAVAVFAIVLSLTVASHAGDDYYVGQAVFKWDSSCSGQSRAELVARIDGTIFDSIPYWPTYYVEFADTLPVSDAVDTFLTSPCVIWAEAIPIPYDGTNDSLYGEQWYLEHLIQQGEPYAQIHAPEAWAIEPGGSRDVRIAVLDRGIPYDTATRRLTHPDLQNSEPDYPFIVVRTDSSDVLAPLSDHGTKVTGIIAANTNNGIGIAGISSRCTILSYMNLTVPNLHHAIDPAGAGADIVISSQCADVPSDPAYSQEIEYAVENDVLLVFLGGNGRTSLDHLCLIAEQADLFPNILAVGGTNLNDARWSEGGNSYSRMGDALNISAPADSITTTDLNGLGYAHGVDGTSVATPMVAATAALVLSQARESGIELTAEQVRDIITQSADDCNYAEFPDRDRYLGYGRVNAFKALLWTPGVKELEADLIIEPSHYDTVSPYRLRGTLVVPDSLTLTIEPGTRILFADSAALYVEGSIIAQGTEENPIRFVPDSAASWGGLVMYNGATGTLEHCEISGGTWVQMQSVADVTVRDCRIHDMVIGVDAYEVEDVTLICESNLIEDCALYGIRGSLSSGTFADNTIENCGRAGIYWLGDHPYTAEAPYFFRNEIASNGTGGTPIAGGYFNSTTANLRCNQFNYNSPYQILCENGGNIVMNGNYDSLGANILKSNVTNVWCGKCRDFPPPCTCPSPPAGFAPLMWLASSVPQLAQGYNTFHFDDDGTFIFNSTNRCPPIFIMDIIANHYEPYFPPAFGNRHFCPTDGYWDYDPQVDGVMCIPGGFLELGGGEELFREAAEAEASGDASQASALYGEVMTQYPESDEALWATRGYLRTGLASRVRPAQAHDSLLNVWSDVSMPEGLRAAARREAVWALIAGQEWSGARNELEAIRVDTVATDDSLWAVVALAVVDFLEEGRGGLDEAGPSAAVSRERLDSFHARLQALMGRSPDVEVRETAREQTSRGVLSVYPNPFNMNTEIRFELTASCRVTMRAYDILGREAGTIADALYSAGRHTILWQCPTCASGTYWISMTGDGFHFVRKAILLR